MPVTGSSAAVMEEAVGMMDWFDVRARGLLERYYAFRRVVRIAGEGAGVGGDQGVLVGGDSGGDAGAVDLSRDPRLRR